MAKKVVSTVPQEGTQPSPLASKLMERNAELVKQQKVLNPEILEKREAASARGYQGIETNYENLAANYYDPFDDYIDPTISRSRAFDYSTMEKMRFENQTLGQEAGNALDRIALNVIPQVIGGVASMVDIQGYWDAEHAANNAIVNWASAVKEKVDEENPIYTNPDGDTMDLGSSAWWFSRGAGLVESVASFIPQGLIAGGIVGMVGKGLKALGTGRALASAASKVNGIKSGANAASIVGRGAETLATSVMMNQSEAVIEASQVYKDIYQKSIEANLNEEEAKKRAADAASTTMRINRLNILLNLSSSQAFLRPYSSVRNILKDPTKAIKHSLIHESGQEAAEELINHVASQAGTAKGEKKNYTFTNALADITSMEGLEAAFLGALGGFGQTGLSHIANNFKKTEDVDDAENPIKVSVNQKLKNDFKRQQAVIEDMRTKGIDMSEALMSTKDFLVLNEKLAEAVEKNDQETYEKLSQQLLSQQFIKAANSGTLSILEDQYKAYSEDETKDKESRKKAKDAVKHLQQLSYIYDNYLEAHNVEDLLQNKSETFRLQNQLPTFNEKLTESHNKLLGLARKIASNYSFSEEYTFTEKKEGKEIKTEQRKREIPFAFDLNNLENPTLLSDENKITYDKFLEEIKQSGLYEEFVHYKEQVSKIEEKIIDLEEEFSTMSSKKGQEKALKYKEAQEKKKAILKEVISADLVRLNALQEEHKDDPELSALITLAIERKKSEEILQKEQERKDLIVKNFKEIFKSITKDTEKKEIEKLYKDINDAEISENSKEALLTELSEIISQIQEQEENPEGNTTNLSSLQKQTNGTSSASSINTNNSQKLVKGLPNNNTEETQVTNETQTLEEEVSKHILNSVVVINQKGLTVNFTRRTEGHSVMAFLSREYTQTNSSGVLSREEHTNSLIESTKHLLDFDKYTPGTKVTLQIDENYDGLVYDPNSTTKEKITWEEVKQKLIAKYGEEVYKESAEYLATVPMVAIGPEGEKAFYLHELSWINDQNIDNTEEEIEKDREKLLDMRETVRQKGQVTTSITSKSKGVFFKTANNEKLLVEEAMPDPKLILAIGKDKKLIASGKLANRKQGGAKGSLDTSKIEDGRLYAIVPTSKDSSAAIPLERTLLSKEVIETIYQAVLAHLSGDETNPVVVEIGQKLRLNLLEIKDLSKFLSGFVHIQQTNKAEGLDGLLSNKIPTYNSAVPVITVTANSIEFGKFGINPILAEKNKKAVVISRSFVENAANPTIKKRKEEENLEKAIALKKHLEGMLTNADNKLISQANSKIALISENGNVKTLSYESYLKTAFKTNILSANIGTEEAPKWVYTIQPTITIDTAFAKGNQRKVTIQQSVPTNNTSKTEEQEAIEQLMSLGKEALEGILDNLMHTKDATIIKQILDSGITEDLLKKAISKLQLQAVNAASAKLATVSTPPRNTAQTTDPNTTEENNTSSIPNSFNVGGLTLFTEENSEEEDDSIDYDIPELSEEATEAIKADNEIIQITGISTKEQFHLISYVSSAIIEAGHKAFSENKLAKISTVEIFNQIKEHFTTASTTYKQFADQARKEGNEKRAIFLEKKASKFDALLKQFHKIKYLTNAHLNLLNAGTFNLDQENLDKAFSVAEDGGLEKTVFTDDWVFSVDSTKQASAQLKQFLTGIEELDFQGNKLVTPLGFPITVPYQVVYEKAMSILANKKASFDYQMELLLRESKNIPWLKSLVDKLENASEAIQNQFTSNMGKHYIEMRFIMWSRNKDGGYSLQDWSANSTQLEERLRSSWKSNLQSPVNKSNLVSLDSDGNYIFDKAEGKRLINQINEWSKLPPSKADNKRAETIKEIIQWFSTMGIIVSESTVDDLMDGKFKNPIKTSWTKLFTDSNGLFRVISKELERSLGTLVDDSGFFNDTVIKKLAALEAKHVNNFYSNSFNAGGKTIFSYNNNNHIVNKFRDLLERGENGEIVNKELLEELSKISYSEDSLWLETLLDSSEEGEALRNNMNISYVSLEALKKAFGRSTEDAKLNSLNTAEHEVTKLGFFFNNSGSTLNPGRRKVRFLHPTMSDKSTMMLVGGNSYALELDEDEFTFSRNILELVFKSAVLPEIKRMQNAGGENLAGYAEGKKYFYSFPGLNTLEIDGNNLLHYLHNTEKLEEGPVKEAILTHIKETLETLSKNQVEEWAELGIGKDNYSFLPHTYINDVAVGATKADKINYAAMDYVFNYVIANAELHKLTIGDPALFFKKGTDGTVLGDIRATLTNLTKRLAGEIAPGLELANSVDNSYIQVFFLDKKLKSSNVTNSIQKEYFSKIIPHFEDGYSDIEGSDAQEYTTWEEHLYVLKGLGRLSAKQFNELSRLLKLSETDSTVELSDAQLGLVLQPLKPVYVGNINEVDNNVTRKVYIKSSSFPLIPQLTRGLEIEKIRVALKKLQDSYSNNVDKAGNPITVRASFNTANKLGAPINKKGKKGVEIFDDNGDVLDNIEITPEDVVMLERKNFRIQQDIPYDKDAASVKAGTQERKLLFLDILDVEVSKGVTGKDLKTIHDTAYKELMEQAQQKLSVKLGITQPFEKDFISDYADSLLEAVKDNNVFAQEEEFEKNIRNLDPIKKQITIESRENTPQDINRINYINANFEKIVELLTENSELNKVITKEC